MKQFNDATFMEDLGTDSKFNMSYRLKELLNETLDLKHYSISVASILFSPVIGNVLVPKSRYLPKKKELSIEFFMDPEEAVQATEEEFFYQMRDGFIAAINEMPLPADFDIIQFTEDVNDLRFDQLKPVV